MKTKRKNLFALLLGILLLVSALPPAALAAGKIVTDQPADLTIHFKDGEKAIPGAHFSIYKVADVDEYAKLELTDEFKTYQSLVSGLSKINDLTQEQWIVLVSTLKGYVLKDGLPPAAEGDTDDNGMLLLPDLEVGLYLVIGDRTPVSGRGTYYPVPFMLLLPEEAPVRNEWDYDVTVVPKFTKERNSQGGYIMRKVLKKWDDVGYETIRPEEVTVQLLRDGTVYDTQPLNEENNWRYSWERLDPDYEWEVIELPTEGYAVSIERSGVTFVVTNKYVVPITLDDPPVQKRVVGDTPEVKSTFTFVMKADDPSFPMPEGSEGSIKIMSIVGPGSVEFGNIIFTKPGIYTYTISERNLGEDGYTYDDTRINVRYDVTEKDGELFCFRTMEDVGGDAIDVAEFTNTYTAPVEKLPQTGVLWWPVPVLLCLGIILVTIGVADRRRKDG